MNLAWYVARSGGMVAFGLLTASVLLGILLAGRKTLPRWPRFAVEDVHRFAGTLTWTFIGVHVAGLLVDTYIGFSLRQVLIPFTSSYRPAATAAGIVGAELLAAIGITNQLKDRAPTLPLAAHALPQLRRLGAVARPRRHRRHRHARGLGAAPVPRLGRVGGGARSHGASPAAEPRGRGPSGSPR